MRYQLIAAFVQLTFLFLLEFTVYRSLRTLLPEGAHPLVLLVPYMLLTLVSFYGLLKGAKTWRSRGLERNPSTSFLLGIGLSILGSKLIFLVLLLVSDTVRIAVACLLWIFDLFSPSETSGFFIPERPYWATAILAILLLGILVAFIFGVLFGKYRFKVEKLTLYFDDLPESFDRFRLLQFSDAHSGSWDSLDGVKKGISLIQKQQADVVFFTGDLVNQFKDEIDPFVHLFAEIKAPFGKYAVLGNHDYYGQPRDHEQRQIYWNDFKHKYHHMGFNLLLNTSKVIEKDGAYIRLIGVENWGSGRWFPKIGDLEKAVSGSDPAAFSILLSHDPSHWDEKVLPFSEHIHLTLSGHTHGMQFGIKLPFFKWSPVQYRYKRWMGLYHQSNQYLYVNRGFGFLGFPGRVGMWPEVTVIELRKKNA